MRCLRGMGVASTELGESARSFEELSQARAMAEEIGDPFLIATVLLPLARAEWAVGELDEARATLEEAVELGQRLTQDARHSYEIELEAMISQAQRMRQDMLH